MQTDFYRIKRLPPYVIEEVNRLKAQARGRGEDIIDFSMGNPDMPTPQFIVDKLIETAKDPRSNRYSASRGIKGLRKAMAAYYQRRFGVTIDPDTEVIANLGSKEGFANLAQAITAPGDVVLVPNPAYPIHAFGFILAGAAIRHVPANTPEEYLSRLGNAVRHSVPSPIALVVNYPSNPTAQVVGLDFYKEIVAFAKKHEIWVLSDLAYADIYFGDEPPPSILQIEGAKDVAIEFQSLSKTFAMPGWRMGFAAGNKHLINALGRIKSYLDYGAYTPIQVAATAALNGPAHYADEIRAIYKARRDVLINFNGQGRVENPFAAGLDVRLGARSGILPRTRFDGVRQAASRPRQGRGPSRDGLRRVRRRLCPRRPGRERASYPAGCPQREALSSPADERAGRVGIREMKPALRVAIAGLGTVGGGVVKALLARRSELAERAGRTIDIVAVSARDRAKIRAADMAKFPWLNDPVALASGDADAVVELIGGEEGVARGVVEASLNAGKHVVTGNKALLAKHGAPLAALAEQKSVALKFEAAVAGGIPIVKALRESLVAYRVAAVRGILNGTCNYILTQMEATGRVSATCSWTRNGSAMPKPIPHSMSAAAIPLTSSRSWRAWPSARCRILARSASTASTHITPDDIRFAREFGFRIKLLGIARHTDWASSNASSPRWCARARRSPTSTAAFNAVMTDNGEAGHFFFEGRGAGEAPTASAVIADLVDIARGNIGSVFGRPASMLKPLVAATAGASPSAFYLRFDVLDVPGVLAEIARHLAESRVSIESMLQRGRAPGETVSIVMITHETPRSQVEHALKAIARSDKVRARPCMIPMEAA